MEPFPIQKEGDAWHVLTGIHPIVCASRQDAEALAQIPVQLELIHDDAPRAPDLDIVRSIIAIGDGYHLMSMFAFRKLRRWLATVDGEAA